MYQTGNVPYIDTCFWMCTYFLR